MFLNVKYLFFIFFHVGLINANCILNMKEDLTANHPLLLSPHSPKWVSMEDSSIGNVVIGRDDSVRISCAKQSSFRHADLKNAKVALAKCKDGKKFDVNGKTYDFADLHCDRPLEATEKSTGQECLGKDTELIEVGFEADKDFVTEYEVCFEKKERFTLYATATIPADIEKSKTPIKEQTWLPKNLNHFRNINMDDAYKCQTQADTFKKILNKEYFDSKNRDCCLHKTKLVVDDYMMQLPEKAATAHYLNAVPQWSACNRKNWLEIEKRVKNLAVSMKKPLKVWTGTYRKMTLAAKWGLSYKDMYLHYNGDSDKAVPVPLYIWKVVYNPDTEKAVAIVQINNPHMSVTDVDSFVLCRDICKNVAWLNFLERTTIRDGYTYCCDLPDFEHGFAFKKSPFPQARGGILRDEPRSG